MLEIIFNINHKSHVHLCKGTYFDFLIQYLYICITQPYTFSFEILNIQCSVLGEWFSSVFFLPHFILIRSLPYLSFPFLLFFTFLPPPLNKLPLLLLLLLLLLPLFTLSFFILHFLTQDLHFIIFPPRSQFRVELIYLFHLINNHILSLHSR